MQHRLYFIISSLFKLGYSNIELANIEPLCIKSFFFFKFSGSVFFVNNKVLKSSACFLFNSSKNSNLTLFPMKNVAFLA